MKVSTRFSNVWEPVPSHLPAGGGIRLIYGLFLSPVLVLQQQITSSPVDPKAFTLFYLYARIAFPSNQYGPHSVRYWMPPWNSCTCLCEKRDHCQCSILLSFIAAHTFTVCFRIKQAATPLLSENMGNYAQLITIWFILILHL